MHSIQDRVLTLAKKAGGTHVGGQHALLNQAVRVVACHRHDTINLSLVGKDHLGLDRLEVDRAAPLARAKQGLE